MSDVRERYIKRYGSKGIEDVCFERDYEYIYRQKSKNDNIWQDLEKRLYFSYKNQNYVFPLILWCIFCAPFNGGIWGIILGIGYVQWLCYQNNKALDENPTVIHERECTKSWRKKSGKY